jgi:hypothetical protein
MTGMDPGPIVEADAFAVKLETDGLAIAPNAVFSLTEDERALLTSDMSDDRAKNISLGPDGALRGTSATDAHATSLTALLERYAGWSRALINELAPRYGPHLERGRASYRPRPIDEAPLSPRKDDRRLHVDAFASQPTGGKRILRVFTNINPFGEARVWRVGEPFEAYARRWIGHARRPWPGEASTLHGLGITKARREPYDFLMLALHDRAKLDAGYQQSAPAREIAFGPGATWLAFTDSVVHAAIAGRHALEQTFYLPLSAMAAPEASPLRILERLEGRRLAPA